jgi:uncharacterized membrane protein YukC
MSEYCQSLNISTKNDKTTKKILALVKEKEDFIMLSDLKLNSNAQNHAIHDLEKNLNRRDINFSTIALLLVGVWESLSPPRYR